MTTDKRPPVADRKFTSAAIERVIATAGDVIKDPALLALFTNCLPNTLDTTVSFGRDSAGRPDTFVITGDIDAMWLRDSTAQVWPYLPLATTDEPLRNLIAGVIHRQAACVRLDPYANAFLHHPDRISEFHSDHTDMRPGVHERKYELDSLCSVLRLSVGYYDATADASPFDDDWHKAVDVALDTITTEQAGSDERDRSHYHFARTTSRATDSLPLAGGHTYPHRRCGLSASPFRPSDDACVFALPIAANAMAVAKLRGLARMLGAIGKYPATASRATALAASIDAGIQAVGVVEHSRYGKIFAYEVDGYGSCLFMDDANVPSLLSLPYLGYCDAADPTYQRTRKFLLSDDNPFYAAGKAGRGIGGPHVGPGWIWPIAITIQALTSTDDHEITDCLRQLKTTDAGTGFMHESFWKDDANRYSRPWFAWANTLFGELILTLMRKRPALLQAAI